MKKEEEKQDFKVYGYTRISTTKESQKHDRQVYLIDEWCKENGLTVTEIRNEVVSGTVEHDKREVYSNMKENLKANDVLIVTDLDRLGRDADSTIMEVKALTKAGIRLVVLDTPYLNSLASIRDESIYKMIVDILVTLKSHIAQQEREKIASRIKQGQEASSKEIGRPKLSKSDISKDFLKHYKTYTSNNLTVADLSRLSQVPRSRVYRYLALLEK